MDLSDSRQSGIHNFYFGQNGGFVSAISQAGNDRWRWWISYLGNWGQYWHCFLHSYWRRCNDNCRHHLESDLIFRGLAYRCHARWHVETFWCDLYQQLEYYRETMWYLARDEPQECIPLLRCHPLDELLVSWESVVICHLEFCMAKFFCFLFLLNPRTIKVGVLDKVWKLPMTQTT